VPRKPDYFGGLKGKAPVVAELSWPQVHAFRLNRHHLTRRAPKKDLARVVGDIGGAQAQLMSAAELQVGVRVGCTVEDVRTALWKDKSLVKTWLMRGTLHLVPAKDLPMYTAAMRTLRMRNLNAWLKFTQMTEPELMSLFDAIGDALDGRTMTREELIASVGRGRSEHVRDVLRSGWGGLLKPVARSGLLCFGPSRGTSVTFVRPAQWLGSWHEVDPDKALMEVARRYLRAYGPATMHDFVRWWGMWTGVGKAAWNGLAKELVTVSVEGQRADMLEADLQPMSRVARGPSIQLLPAFDPYLMGHSSRDHLFGPAHRWRVSRVSGWISAVVLAEGRVAATWSHTVVKQTLRIAIEPLGHLSSKARPEIRARSEELAATLGLAKAEVTFA
jgi:Winged helix DNA-binding domain